jgi:hypothetical protein
MYSEFISSNIINWLLKNGCANPKDSQTTESRYVKFEQYEIRVSTHLPGNLDVNRIFIMVPSDKNHAFGVFIYRRYHTFNTVSELKSFLKSLFIVLDSEYKFLILKNEIPDKDRIIRNLQDRIKNQEAELKALKNKNNGTGITE